MFNLARTLVTSAASKNVGRVRPALSQKSDRRVVHPARIRPGGNKRSFHRVKEVVGLVCLSCSLQKKSDRRVVHPARIRPGGNKRSFHRVKEVFGRKQSLKERRWGRVVVLKQQQTMSAVAPSARKGQKAEKEINHDESDKHFMIAYEKATQRISKYSVRNETPIGHTGLVNLGNACFMNAILQPLLHAPIFSQLFLEKSAQGFVNGNNGKKGIISGAFSALIDLALSGEFSAISPAFFLEIIARNVNRQFGNKRQHDAEEFQIYLLDAFREEMKTANGLQSFEQNYDSSNLRKSASDFFKRSQLFSSSPINGMFNVSDDFLCNSMQHLRFELPTNKNCLNLKDCLEAHFLQTVKSRAQMGLPEVQIQRAGDPKHKIWTVELTFDVDQLDLAPFLHDMSPLKIAVHADSGSDAEAADSGTPHDSENSDKSGTDFEEEQDGSDAEAADSGTPHDSESELNGVWEWHNFE
ncbi:hypothetical protein niasHS_016767 [Heterodera schachtii]|uniref:ubiquitinyl hydrolase 1 n=1 Tax=Heterodera schachtii TaxID=97005 RepID=A0ABD2HW29_HETSC